MISPAPQAECQTSLSRIEKWLFAPPASSMSSAPVPAKVPRASTSSKNRARSPSPYRSRAGQASSEFVNEFWQHSITTAESAVEDFKHQALPLARIRKVLRSDPDIKMVSAEVTVILEKACQIFIQELTARSHHICLDARRRTLSKPDVAQAVSNSEQYDFLIDLISREDPEMSMGVADGTVIDSTPTGRKRRAGGGAKGKRARATSIDVEQEGEEGESSTAKRPRASREK